MFQRFARLGFLVQEVETGILPALYAATSPQAKGGASTGPRASPTSPVVLSSRNATSSHDAERIWQVSEQLTHITFPTV